MKFIHIADMHFDMPFTVLSKNGLAEERRLDQRKVFKKTIFAAYFITFVLFCCFYEKGF